MNIWCRVRISHRVTPDGRVNLVSKTSTLPFQQLTSSYTCNVCTLRFYRKNSQIFHGNQIFYINKGVDVARCKWTGFKI